jgi:NTE family protein
MTRTKKPAPLAAPLTLKGVKPRIALALGGGGARGLAHIVVLETLDRLEIRPAMIAGTSMGAIIGACYAAGHSGASLRKHALHIFRDQTQVMAKLFKARVGRFADFWKEGLTNPVLVDGEQVLAAFWPKMMPERFEDLCLPLRVIAADYHRFERVMFETGPLLPAIAGSMAIPGLVKPVLFQNRVLVDGYAVDPLPVSALKDQPDLLVAIDVSGRQQREEISIPTPLETTFGAFELMQAALADASFERLTGKALRIRAPVEEFGALDFFKTPKILAKADGMVPELEALLKAL